MAKGMTGAWKPTSNMLKKAGDEVVWQAAKKPAMLKEAHRIRGLMVQAFNAGGPSGKKWKRLSFFTKLVSWAKGHGIRGRPLMVTGDLRNSHSVVDVDFETVFVGVHRSTRGRRNKNKLVNIAAVHENGSDPISINVSPGSAKGQRVRRFFFWLFKKTRGRIKPLRKDTTVLVMRIPPRPWVGPIWEAEGDDSARNITRDTMRAMGVSGIGRGRQ